MHIHELIRSLKQQGNVEYQQDGRLRVISSVIAAPLDGSLSNLIRKRITYYCKTMPELTDFLVLAAHLGDWPAFQQYAVCFRRQYEGDLDEIFNEMGVAVINPDTGVFHFVHEHYKAIFSELPLSDDQSIDNCLRWARDARLKVSVQIECRLYLLQKTVNYGQVCRRLLDALKEETEELIRFDLLQMLRYIPQELLEAAGMPLHRLYRLLENACMGMGNWETAESYVLALKDLAGNSPAYQIDALFARKSLSNNYSFRMKFDCAKEECEEAVTELEDYLKTPPPMTAAERKALSRELCMLKNRLSIVYYLCGKHEKADETDQDALRHAKEEGDLYVQYHIQYEQGLRQLRSNPQCGLAMIEDSYKNLPKVEKLHGTQEIDLVRADYRMAQLKTAGLKGIWETELLEEIRKDASETCRRLSNKRERVESILYHAIYGMVSVIEGELQEALRRFQSAAEISYKASITHMIWKMHLNIAQCYDLMLRACTSPSDEEYRRNIRFHADEAIAVLERALEENPLTRSSLRFVLEYPLDLALCLSNGCPLPKPEGLAANYCGIHINYYDYAFFLLD